MKRKTSTVRLWALVALCLLAWACASKRDDTTQADPEFPAWAMLPFEKVDSINPILLPGQNTFVCPILNREVKWEEKDVFNPAAVVHQGKVYLLYRAEDTIGKHAGTSRIGLAVSDDGLHFTKMKHPVLYPDHDSLKVYEWEGGIEDPRVVMSDSGTYVMTYTAYDGITARLLLATSKDLVHWTKHGPVLQGKFKNTWSKSGAIVSRHEAGKIVASKIHGKYWMYFGDSDLFMATSPDLIHWTPVTAGDSLRSVLKPRPGYFDSRVVESGPYGLITNDGILMLYNSMNLDKGGDSTLAPGAYCAGQVLFDQNDPAKVLQRLETNFMKPDKPYEITGQVNQVCFIEGMVYFKGRWMLYYGTADSKIAVAVK